MKTIKKILFTTLIFGLLFSCSNDNLVENSAPTKTVNLTVASAKTITPDAVSPVVKYVFTLTSTTSPETIYTAESDTGSVSIEKVLLGTYKVNVKGYSDVAKQQLSQEGNSAENLVVSMTGNNTAIVKMNLIYDEGTGSIKIPVDCSKVVTNQAFSQALTDGIRFELYVDNQLQDSTHILKDVDFVANKAEITFTNVPVGLGKVIYLKLYNNVTGQMLVRTFFTSIANVYAGQVSVPDVNETGSEIIMPNSIVSAKNISGIKIEPNATNMDTAVDITWNNPQQNNKNLVKEVTFKYSTSTGPEIVKTITFDEVNAATDLVGKTTLDQMVAGQDYELKYSLKYFNGMYSQERILPYKLSSYVFVTALTLDNSSIPTNALTDGNTFAPKASVLPENATEKGIVWESSANDVLTFRNGLFEAHKPGKATITAKTLGYKDSLKNVFTQQSTTEVQVILNTPVLYAETTDHVINVNWNAVQYAEEYALYEVVDGVVAKEPITIKAPTTTYSKNTGIIAGAQYEYYVVAKAPTLNTVGFTADSKQSEKTAPITPIKPNISVENPVLTPSPELQFGAGSVESVITPEQSELVFTISNPSPDYTYTWYINGVEVNPIAVNTISINTNTQGIFKDGSTTYNTLMLKAVSNTNPANIISKTTTFEVIDVMDTGVEVFINGSVDGKRFISTTDKTVKLSYQVLPESASNQNVTFDSSDKTVATVDEFGTITILKDGDTNITVKPAHGTPVTLAFKFYKPTFTSPLEILNAVNSVLRTHVTAADTQFGSDWWDGGAKEYKATGVIIKSSSATSQAAGEINLTNLQHEVSVEKGMITLNTTNVIRTWANGYSMGYLYQDPLQTIGYNNQGTIKVDLPFNQGSVNIHYSNINVEGSGRSGSYSLEFIPVNLGDKTYKLFTDIVINDDASVTRILN